MVARLAWLLLLINLPFVTLAQLQIAHPMPRLVVQRGADGNGRLYLSGRLTGTVDRVEAQLTPVVAGQGTATDWQTVQTNPANGIFLGFITGTGGWYVLTVRTVIGTNITEQASVQPVGIGEVFITAGQSNSRGLGTGDNDLGTATDRVNGIDAINHFYPPGINRQLFSSGDPSPVPVFSSLTAGKRIFPMAESSWCWGELGDYIVNRFNVPVAFYVVGWDGSTVDNWNSSANGIPTCNRYNCSENWANLQPYTNLKNILSYYASVGGARSILWQQGEAEFGDAGSGSIPEYRNRLTSLIQKTRQDFGGRNLTWVVARASFDGNTSRPDVINAQNQVILTAGLNVYPGPSNDGFTNRNAGSNDVHFRNASRPSTHPRYYLNPGSIPVEMGLSRLASSWNSSLDNNFFQNAQPITPTQFAVTGTVANYIAPGSTINVPFSTLGTFNGDNQWQVQLLDSLGQYKAVLGSGPTSPLQVTLPASYTNGRFQVRVVATSPALPAVPSNLFQISNLATQADINLAMGISQRTPDVNAPVTISLIVRNEGPGQAANLTIRNRLPDNLAFVSASGMTFSENVLTGTVASLNADATATLSFVAQPIAAGTYRNAAEIAQGFTTDPDSQPNSGTGDGQDDAAALDFRTRQPGSAVFTSPNPNQAPLPAVSSNQPTPDPTLADVSVSLSVSNRAPGLNEVVTYTLTISNRGGQEATGLSLTAYLPTGQTFVPGDDLAPSGGNFVGGVSSLAANSSITLRFRATTTAVGRGICAVQLSAAGKPDPDSVPGNGVDNGEDDTARVDVRVR
jgi:uncharacterized repeat protein (TIGR01451 family)